MSRFHKLRGNFASSNLTQWQSHNKFAFSTNRVTCVVDLFAVQKNLQVLRDEIGPKCNIMVVVKGNAYGHGACQIAQTTLEAGANCLGVGSTEEGVMLRLSLPPRLRHRPIFLLNPFCTKDVKTVVRYRLRPLVGDENALEHLSRTAILLRRDVCLDLHFNLGMGRHAAAVNQGELLANLCQTLPGLTLGSISTHFPTPADANSTQQQIANFTDLIVELTEKGLLPVGLPAHAAASIAAIRYSVSRFDMVRAGKILYGLLNTEDTAKLGGAITPVLHLRTCITAIQERAIGSTEGYRSFRYAKSTRIAILPIGTSDGYRTELAGNAVVLVSGRRCPVIDVTMNATVIDVTGIDAPQIGQEVVLLGIQGSEQITILEMADWISPSFPPSNIIMGLNVPITYHAASSTSHLLPERSIVCHKLSQHNMSARYPVGSAFSMVESHLNEPVP